MPDIKLVKKVITQMLFKGLLRFLTIKTCFILGPALIAADAQSLLWQKEYEGFCKEKTNSFRATRPNLKRFHVPFECAVDILKFIERSASKYGPELITREDQVIELIIDLCDIVNLQHPDFKRRYDIFIQQGEDGNQLPFSLFTFDKIAQVLHNRSDLFSAGDHSGFKQIISQIIRKELPFLRMSFELIRDLENYKSLKEVTNQGTVGNIYYANYLYSLNISLDKIRTTKTRSEQAKLQKSFRKRIPTSIMENTYILSSMAHDYLTLGRMEKILETTISVTGNTPQNRAAFLAGMIQIGELSTNKNLSTFVRDRMVTVPWQDLINWRDAIEHQDEHGFVNFFSQVINGDDRRIDFNLWARDLKCLKGAIAKTRSHIWGIDHKAQFDTWIKAELAKKPIYSTKRKRVLTTLEERIRKPFRQTLTFTSDPGRWKNLMGGEALAEYDDFKNLRDAIKRIHSLSEAIPKEKDEKAGAQKQIGTLKEVEHFLWSQFSSRASTYLQSEEIEFLIKEANSHIEEEGAFTFILAILTKNNSFLNKDKWDAFKTLMSTKGGHAIYAPIIIRLLPIMPVTRQFSAILKFDQSKGVEQAERKALAQRMFLNTSEHLHDLAHGPDFSKRMFEEMLTIPKRFAFRKLVQTKKGKKLERELKKIMEDHSIRDPYGYYNPTRKGLEFIGNVLRRSKVKLDSPSPATPGYTEFGKEVMRTFYEQAHRFQLIDCIRTNPVSYLASVYSLSVGMSALKEWIEREDVIPSKEREAYEKLRPGRNFIAHGDLFHIMGGIDLSDVQADLLIDHYKHCEMLDFIL